MNNNGQTVISNDNIASEFNKWDTIGPKLAEEIPDNNVDHLQLWVHITPCTSTGHPVSQEICPHPQKFGTPGPYFLGNSPPPLGFIFPRKYGPLFENLAPLETLFIVTL